MPMMGQIGHGDGQGLGEVLLRKQTMVLEQVRCWCQITEQGLVKSNNRCFHLRGVVSDLGRGPGDVR